MTEDQIEEALSAAQEYFAATTGRVNFLRIENAKTRFLRAFAARSGPLSIRLQARWVEPQPQADGDTGA